MKRKWLSLVLALALVLSLVMPVAAASTISAQPTGDTVTVDGELVGPVAAYKINGENYFKLRDIAAVVNGTDQQFAVDFDTKAQTINAATGKPYSTVGGELSGTAVQAAAAVSNWALLVNGTKQETTAYTIGGNNYYRLRDLGSFFGFGVDYDEDAKTVSITTTAAPITLDLAQAIKDGTYQWKLSEDGSSYILDGTVYCTAPKDVYYDADNKLTERGSRLQSLLIVVPAAYLNADGTVNSTGKAGEYTAETAPLYFGISAPAGIPVFPLSAMT